MENVSWTDHVRNEEVLTKNQGGEGCPEIIKRNKAYFIGHILYRNCLIKHVIEGKIEERI